MALAPQHVQIAPASPPPAGSALTADEIKTNADAFEANVDAWLGKPKSAPPPYAFHVSEPEVLEELVRRYQAAGWPGAHAKHGLHIVLDMAKPEEPPAAAYPAQENGS